MKMKQCSKCTYVGPIYKNITVDGIRLKLCKSCAMSISSKDIVVKKQKPIKPVSDKRQKQNTAYLLARKIFLMEERNKYCPVTGGLATEIHHINGRENERLLNRKYWLAVSRDGHKYIHDNPSESRVNGWLI